jgi:hypothetical protein
MLPVRCDVPINPVKHTAEHKNEDDRVDHHVRQYVGQFVHA